MKLSLGVVDIIYGHTGGHGGNPNNSTGNVAEILEKNYGIMGHFYDLHKDEINEALTDIFSAALEDSMMGLPINFDNTSEEISGKLKPMFQKMILDRELDGVDGGVPTKASLGGVSHRKKKGVHRNKAVRPSFLDTHLYYSSFKAWLS